MAKKYKITFPSKSAIGIVLYELNAWCVNPKEYKVSDKEFVIYNATANVVDVVTETLNPKFCEISIEQKEK